MTGEKVLLIEDDASTLRGLKDNFGFSGFCVATATDGKEGLDRARTLVPDLIVLDIMLPRLNGYELCRVLRDEGFDMPIIMLTAKDRESELLLGLNIGADDYVTKPFSIDELLARANALLRRQRRQERSLLCFGDCTLDRRARQVRKADRALALTPKEFRLLDYLIREAGRAVPREELVRAVWGSVVVTSRAVDRSVTTLRAKIEVDPRNPRWLVTVRDVGYRFEALEEDEQGSEDAGC